MPNKCEVLIMTQFTSSNFKFAFYLDNEKCEEPPYLYLTNENMGEVLKIQDSKFPVIWCSPANCGMCNRI